MIECFLNGTAKDIFLINLANSVKGIIHQSNTNKSKLDAFETADWPSFDWKKWTNKPVAVVGTLRGSERVIWESQNRNHPFLYFDHAYFHATRDYKPGKFGLLYRLIKSQMQLNKLVNLEKEDYDRISKFKPIDVKPFKKGGEHILLCPPTKAICRLYDLGFEDMYIESMITEISKYTDRNIIVRTKDTKLSLEEQLKDCHAVVTHQSTVAINAILNGVPSFCDEVSQSKPVSETDISRIETPFYPDEDLINKWIDSLLSCQFTMEEIKNGTAYNTVMRLQ